MKNYSKLYSKIGYTFNKPDLLKLALTHKSYSKNNNERLEFLGDSILGYIISTTLFQISKNFDEGELTRCRAHLVRGDTLQELSIELELMGFMLLGTSEAKHEKGPKTSILANAIEAIIGAIYLDSDMVTCQQVVVKWYESRLANICPTKARDCKTILQEYLQSKGTSLPNYSIESIEGQEHEQTFIVSCFVKELEGKTTGTGKSRRKAEQQAAQKYLDLIKYEY